MSNEHDPEESVSSFSDPEGEPPWAMQLVMRIEKTNPPTRTEVCAAAAAAVAGLLHRPEAKDPDQWQPAITRWTDGRIRKHARRARGAAWEKTQQLPGHTATVGGAQVRAFVPTSVKDIPKDIAKLQLSGSELHDPTPVRVIEDDFFGGALLVALQPDPFLPLGKAAAAAGHAAQVSAMRMSPTEYHTWAAAGFPVTLAQPGKAEWAQFSSVAPVVIADAGFTIVEPGTVTAAAAWD